MDTTIYYAAAEGFIEGKYRKLGDKIGALSEAKAKYPLLTGQITSTPPTAQKASSSATSKAEKT